MRPERISSYIIEEELGEGGMAVVYRARHSVLEGESVAIKVLHSHLTRNESVKQRFLNEARMMHSLSHENIVSVKDVFEFEGQLVIVMEYISGRPLSKIIGEEVGPITYTKAIPLFMQILEGTSYAHSKGIVHRDLKPDNILVNSSGRAKITDFGIAKISGESSLTRTGARVGTPSYMAPEQVLGKGVDARTDVYSLGITLYEMLAGVLPFEKQSTSEFELMKAIVDGSIPDPRESYPHIPQDVVEVLFKAVKREPEKRYQSCSSLAKALRLIECEDDSDGFADNADPLSPMNAGTVAGYPLSAVLQEDSPVQTDEPQTVSASSTTYGNIISEGVMEVEVVDITSSESDVILTNFIAGAQSSQQVRSVLLDPRGKSGAIAGRSTLIAVDFASGKEKTLRLPGGYVTSTDSVSGYHAIVTGENQISLWNSMFSSELGYIPSMYQKIQDVAFQLGDNLMILAGNSILSCGLPSVWRRNPKLESFAALSDDRNTLLEVSRDGSYIALADSFGSVNIHSSGVRFERLVHVDSGSTVKRISFSPRGRHLATLTHEGRLMILELASGRLLRFAKEMTFLDVCFTEEKLIGLTFEDDIYFWDCGQFDSYQKSIAGELLTGLYGSLKSSVFAVSHNSGEVKFYDLTDTITV